MLNPYPRKQSHTARGAWSLPEGILAFAEEKFEGTPAAQQKRKPSHVLELDRMQKRCSGKRSTAATLSPRTQQAACRERRDTGGANFLMVRGGRSRYLPAGTQTLFADAISAFATFVEMLTLCSPSLLCGIA